MGKRANIRATARATQTMVWQNRAAHLREQGVLAPSAGPGDAQAHDRAAAKAAFRARVEAGPGGWAAFRAGQVVGAVVLLVLVAAVVVSGTGAGDPVAQRNAALAETVCPALDSDPMADPLVVVPGAADRPGPALMAAADAIDFGCYEHHRVAVMWRGVASSLPVQP